MHNHLVCDESSSEPRQRGVWRHLCGVIMAVLVVGASYSTAGAQTQPRAYVANPCNNMVSVIDTATNTIITTIPVGDGPVGVAITPDGTRVYVTNNFSDTVSVIDTAIDLAVIAAFRVGDGPSGVAITPDGTRAYVTNQLSNTVSVINTATNTFIATIVGVACPSGIAITTQARVPLSIEECKNGGWRSFGPPAGPFRNQGECVSYVKNKSKNR